MSPEELERIKAMPDRELLKEIFRLSGFEKARPGDFKRAINP